MRILAILLLSLFFVGCSQKNTSIENSDAKVEAKTTIVNIVLVSEFKDHNDGVRVGGGIGIGSGSYSGFGGGISIGKIFGGPKYVKIDYEKDGVLNSVIQEGKECEFVQGEATLINNVELMPNSKCR